MTVHFNDLSKDYRSYRCDGNAALGGDGNLVYRRYGKRAFDVAAVLLTSPVTVPIVLFLALLSMLDGGKPFFLQERVGQNDRIFRMWKLRTMVANAEERLEAHLSETPEARAEWDANQKLIADPRVTRIGRFMRCSSLDELPQLWNVLIGDMSLVGPRPMMCSQRALYPGYAYYHLRPGITGPWQVSKRNSVEFKNRAVFDHSYLEEMSLTVDLRLLARTVRAVARCTGV